MRSLDERSLDERSADRFRSFDRFKAGVSLNAVYECDGLNNLQQSVLLFLGHSLEHRLDNLVNVRGYRLHDIAAKCRLPRLDAEDTVKELVNKGYIRANYFLEEKESNAGPEYLLTSKVFDEYEAKNR